MKTEHETYLAAADVLVFLKVLSSNHVCIVHLLGRFSCRLGRPTESHNCIFGILGDKVGGNLNPIDMVPVTGMLSWIQLEKQVNPMEADLEGLTADT